MASLPPGALRGGPGSYDSKGHAGQCDDDTREGWKSSQSCFPGGNQVQVLLEVGTIKGAPGATLLGAQALWGLPDPLLGAGLLHTVLLAPSMPSPHCGHGPLCS